MKIVINPLRPVLCDQDGDFHVLLRLQSEPVKGFQPTPLSLALVVDRSGSIDRKSTRLNSSHSQQSRMPSSA